MTKRYYGWKPSKPHFAKRYSLYHLPVAHRPAVVDLSAHDCPIFDQGQWGSCTANGLAGLLGFLNPGQVFSRSFIYDMERSLEGTFGQDNGAEIHDGIKVLYTFGCPFEAAYPYTDDNLKTKPSDDVIQQGRSNIITDYYNLETFDDVLNCLASGFPVVFGIQVHESFESEDVASTGMVPIPGPDDDVVGGHCMKVVGYDDNRRLLIVDNSWGTGWGDKGRCYIPYDYFQNEANDMWKILSDTLSRSQ
jgi:C1A family cysteine protease